MSHQLQNFENLKFTGDWDKDRDVLMPALIRELRHLGGSAISAEVSPIVRRGVNEKDGVAGLDKDKRVPVSLLPSHRSVRDRNSALATIVNTTTETAFYSVQLVSKEIDPAKHGLEFWISGDYFNDSGAGRTVRLRIKVGGITLYDDTSISIAVNATARRPWFILCRLNQIGQTVYLSGLTMIGEAGATVGSGNFGNDEINANAPISNLSTSPNVQLAGGPLIEFTVQHSFASASLEWRMMCGSTEILRVA